MKLHIKNINITFGNNRPPAGLIAALAIAGAAKSSLKQDAPEIGECWPGTNAIYAGTALSKEEDCLVHLIVWPEDIKKGLTYQDAVEHAESINPETGSHLPTRHQSITLFERLQDQFDENYYHWTLTKTKSGNSAFYQYFNYGIQDDYDLSAECRVRAVSEIPL